jgi:hypothetical protein
MKTTDAAEIHLGANGLSSPIPTHTSGHRSRSAMRISPLPMEWMDPMSWRLPSGKALAEFALQAGFLAPLLFRADGFRKSALKESPGMAGNTAQARGKQLSKGASR